MSEPAPECALCKKGEWSDTAVAIGAVVLVAVGVALYFVVPPMWTEYQRRAEEGRIKVEAERAAAREREETLAKRRAEMADRARPLLPHRTWQMGTGRELTFATPFYAVEVQYLGKKQETYRVPPLRSARLTEDFDAARTVVFFQRLANAYLFCAIDRANPQRRRVMRIEDVPPTSRIVNTRGRTISTIGDDLLIDGVSGGHQPEYEQTLGRVGLGFAILSEPPL